MDYSFTLNFDELSEELQEQKIDEVIEYDHNVRNIETEEDDPKFTLDYQLENEKVRDRTREFIEMHFPLYF